MKCSKTNRVKTHCSPSCHFPFLLRFLVLFLSAVGCPPRRASRLACTWSPVPGGGDGEPVIDACPWWSRSAHASCRERRARARSGRMWIQKERICCSDGARGRCEVLAGREDIITVQGQADKECHIITSPYVPRRFDPIYLGAPPVAQAQWAICSPYVYCCVPRDTTSRNKPWTGTNSQVQTHTASL